MYSCSDPLYSSVFAFLCLVSSSLVQSSLFSQFCSVEGRSGKPLERPPLCGLFLSSLSPSCCSLLLSSPSKSVYHTLYFSLVLTLISKPVYHLSFVLCTFQMLYLLFMFSLYCVRFLKICMPSDWIFCVIFNSAFETCISSVSLFFF